MWGSLTLLEAVRACYIGTGSLFHCCGSGEASSLQARCSALIALWLIRVEELGLGVDLVSLPALDFCEAGGSGFAETFEVVPNHMGTSQRVQKFL